MSFQIETLKLNELLDTNFEGCTAAYGVVYSVFKATDSEDFEDFAENANCGEWFADEDGYDYIKVYDKDRDAVIVAIDCETDELSVF